MLDEAVLVVATWTAVIAAGGLILGYLIGRAERRRDAFDADVARRLLMEVVKPDQEGSLAIGLLLAVTTTQVRAAARNISSMDEVAMEAAINLARRFPDAELDMHLIVLGSGGVTEEEHNAVAAATRTLDVRLERMMREVRSMREAEARGQASD